ncbi:MAG: polyprenyl synthetase family protein [Kiritimatiellae bacterium]|nr:polyprenyl synthetase family protein [Kiritimatiellia bacterium]
MSCTNDPIITGLDDVRQTILANIMQTAMAPLLSDLGPSLGGGKMLRSRLVLAVGLATDMDREILLANASAVEMLQSASLLHDDVIDGGIVRRGEPAFWVKHGSKGAILMGDFLVSRAVGLVQTTNPQFVSMLVETIQEMCETEALQEFLINEENHNWETCVRIARSKTGSLFGYAAACCHSDPKSKLTLALREAGYQLGTAYQLADDILDTSDTPMAADKTLGTDSLGDKLTAASFNKQADPNIVIASISTHIESAREKLADWPHVQKAWDGFVERDVQPVIELFTSCSRSEDAA